MYFLSQFGSSTSYNNCKYPAVIKKKTKGLYIELNFEEEVAADSTKLHVLNFKGLSFIEQILKHLGTENMLTKKARDLDVQLTEIQDLLSSLKKTRTASGAGDEEPSCWESELNRMENDFNIMRCVEKIMLLVKHLANGFVSASACYKDDQKLLLGSLTNCCKKIKRIYMAFPSKGSKIKVIHGDVDSPINMVESVVHELGNTVRTALQQYNFIEENRDNSVELVDELVKRTDFQHVEMKEQGNLKEIKCEELKSTKLRKLSADLRVAHLKERTRKLVAEKIVLTGKTNRLQERVFLDRAKIGDVRRKGELQLLSEKLLLIKEQTIASQSRLTHEKAIGKLRQELERDQQLISKLLGKEADLEAKTEENIHLSSLMNKNEQIWQKHQKTLESVQFDLERSCIVKDREKELVHARNKELEKELEDHRWRENLLRQEMLRNKNMNARVEEQIQINHVLKQYLDQLKKSLRESNKQINAERSRARCVGNKFRDTQKHLLNLLNLVAAIKSDVVALTIDRCASRALLQNQRELLAVERAKSEMLESQLGNQASGLATLEKLCAELRDEVADKDSKANFFQQNTKLVKALIEKAQMEMESTKSKVLKISSQLRVLPKSKLVCKPMNRGKEFKRRALVTRALEKKLDAINHKLEGAKIDFEFIQGQYKSAQEVIVQPLKEEEKGYEHFALQNIAEMAYLSKKGQIYGSSPNIQDDHVKPDTLNRAVSLSSVAIATKQSMLRTSVGRTFGDRRLKLLRWCQIKTRPYGIPMYEFCISWSNGHALCAILHSYRPDLVDPKFLKCKNPAETLAYGVKIAEFLGIQCNFDFARVCQQRPKPNYEKVIKFVELLYCCLEGGNDN